MGLRSCCSVLKKGWPVFLFVLLGGVAVKAETGNGLQLADCAKCHAYEVEAINAKGGSHRSKVSCLDCHQSAHPPKGIAVIPPCSQCHSGSPHFSLTSCGQCHTVAHMPMTSLEFPGGAKAECLSCHEKQGRDFAEVASRHAVQSCAFCHPVHKEIPGCLQCHGAHLDAQTVADCLSCHPAHSPSRVLPPGNTPGRFCEPCHGEEARKIGKTTRRHGTLTCVYCHAGQHPAPLPQCQSCHGTPHPWKMLSQHKNCLECHMDPHALI
ncbi:cytochrome C [Thiovibrio sp. JS02]